MRLSHLEHAPDDDLHDAEEAEKVKHGEKFGPDQRRCHREPFCGYGVGQYRDLSQACTQLKALASSQRWCGVNTAAK